MTVMTGIFCHDSHDWELRQLDMAKMTEPHFPLHLGAVIRVDRCSGSMAFFAEVAVGVTSLDLFVLLEESPGRVLVCSQDGTTADFVTMDSISRRYSERVLPVELCMIISCQTRHPWLPRP